MRETVVERRQSWTGAIAYQHNERWTLDETRT